MLATASLMLLSMMLGATGTFAVVHQEAALYRELHVQKAAILLERAKVRLERRQEDLTDIEPRAEQGFVNPTVVGKYRQEYAEAVAEVHQRELDLKEVRITGRPPIDDLTAPLIEGADFVMQRLQTRLEPVDVGLQRRRTEFVRLEKLVDEGLVNRRELIVSRTKMVEAEMALVRLQRRITLRRTFIAGEITPEEAELRAMLRDAEADYEVAAARLDGARMRLEQVAARHQSGTVTRGELRDAETDVRDAESELALAELELKMFRERLKSLEQDD